MLLLRSPLRLLLWRSASGQSSEREVAASYGRLGLGRGCSAEELKAAYLALVRRLHPDTGGSDADAEAFQEVRAAYKTIVDSAAFSDEAEAREELADLPPIFDIRHTAPQHRQYLEHDGLGLGTPSQRQKQVGQIRVMRAASAASQYAVDKLARPDEGDSALAAQDKDAEYSRRWKTRNAMDRLVEDLILESMAKGEFSDLPGAGKPLPTHDEAPHVDHMTQKLNRVLINNGFVPQWITAEKELREWRQLLRANFLQFRRNFRRQLDEDSFTLAEREAFDHRRDKLVDQLRLINRDIDRFNLIVPVLDKQWVQLELGREMERARTALGEEVHPPAKETHDLPQPPQSEPTPALKSLLEALKAK